MTGISLQDAPTSPAGQDCDSGIINNNNTRLETVLNGGIDDVNLAVNSPAVVATTIAGLGAGRAGKLGLIRAGDQFLRVVYSASLGKWVSAPMQLGRQTSDFSSSHDVFTILAQLRMRRMEFPFKDLYDAGLRPQVFISGFKSGGDVSGATDGVLGQLRVDLVEWADGDTNLGNVVYRYDTATIFSEGIWLAEGWADMVLQNAPTKLYVQAQVWEKGWLTELFVEPPNDFHGDTKNVSVWLRWLG